MKPIIRFAVAALCFYLMSVATAVAQDQYTEGGVTRVTLVQILPGHLNAFMEDLKHNIQPLWEAQKKAGLIESYGIFLNATKANPENSIGISAFLWAIRISRRSTVWHKKFSTLRMKQYGDKNKESRRSKSGYKMYVSN